MKDVFFTDSKYKIGILCACEKELKPYLAAMQNPVAEEYAMHIFYSGRIKERNIVAVYSGCGKINAAITAQQLIDQYDVDAIIFSGIAGGMKKDTGIFDTVVCTSSEFRDTNNGKTCILCGRSFDRNCRERGTAGRLEDSFRSCNYGRYFYKKYQPRCVMYRYGNRGGGSCVLYVRRSFYRNPLYFG